MPVNPGLTVPQGELVAGLVFTVPQRCESTQVLVAVLIPTPQVLHLLHPHNSIQSPGTDVFVGVGGQF